MGQEKSDYLRINTRDIKRALVVACVAALVAYGRSIIPVLKSGDFPESNQLLQWFAMSLGTGIDSVIGYIGINFFTNKDGQHKKCIK